MRRLNDMDDYVDTEFILRPEDFPSQLDEQKIPEFDEKSVYILTLIEVNRHLQEIEHLFQIYKTNLNLLLNHYVLYKNDSIIRKVDAGPSDYININAMIINMISAGKILVDSIETLFSYLNSQFQSQKNDFKKDCISYYYDKYFSYRLFYFLRNYSQHGHLPISSPGGKRYYFDLQRILETPHFNVGSKFAQEFERIKKDIYKQFHDYPRIAVTTHLIEYNLIIHKIYKRFLDELNRVYFMLIDKKDEIVENHPEFIQNCGAENRKVVVIRDDKNGVHIFDNTLDLKYYFNELIKAAENELSLSIKEKNEYDGK